MSDKPENYFMEQIEQVREVIQEECPEQKEATLEHK